MDDLSTSSGRNSEATTDHEPGRLSLETRGRDEMTLMRLRRLTKTVMCKSERHRFEAKTLQRSNIIKYLEENLMHSSEQIRSLSLLLLCCTIPKLGSKIDYLLKPILPKVFQCFKKNKTKELKTRAIHFLRGYFLHTRKIPGFIEDFVKLGIQNPDPEIQISCCSGLSIIFDQDIENNLYSLLIVSVANIFKKKWNFDLARSAYRALKYIHQVVKDARFRDLINMAHPEAAEVYFRILKFEATDTFLNMESNDCSTVILEYQIKRECLRLRKDFGILDPSLLHRIQISQSCERAKAVCDLFATLKYTSWTVKDLEPHIIDLLKVVKSFVFDSNRLVQIHGFDVLKEIINRVGFTLAPYIHEVIEILEYGLISANSKIKMKVYRVLHKLMRCIHPMTIVWNLLNTRDALVREAVFVLLRSMLHHFSYHEFDMIELCKYLGHYLEDSNIKLASISKECIILLFDMMRDCPAYGIKIKAIRSLLKNQNLNTQTLKDIGIIENITEHDYEEDFESLSDEEVEDPNSSERTTVIPSASSRRSLSTAGDSDSRFCVCRGLNSVKSFYSLYRNGSSSNLKREYEMVGMDISTSMSHRCLSTAGESDFEYNDISENNKSRSKLVPNMHKEYGEENKESLEKINPTERLDSDMHRNNQMFRVWWENCIGSLDLCRNASSSSVKREYEIVGADISTAMSHRCLTTAGKSDAKYNDTFKNNKSYNEYVPNMHEEYGKNYKESLQKITLIKNLDSEMQRNNQMIRVREEHCIDSLKKTKENNSDDLSITSSLKERSWSSDSTASKFSLTTSYIKDEVCTSNQPLSDLIEMTENLSPEKTEHEDFNIHQISTPYAVEKVNSDNETRRYFKNFHRIPEIDGFDFYSEIVIKREPDVNLENALTQESHFETETKAGLHFDDPNGIQVDIMNNSFYNFNIMTIEHTENDNDSNATGDFLQVDDSSEMEEICVINQSREPPLETGEDCPRHKQKIVRKSMIPKYNIMKLNKHDKNFKISDVSKDLPQSNSLSEKLVESNKCDQKEICVECVNDSLFDKIPFPVTPITEITLLNKETHNVPLDSLDKEITSAQQNNIAEELNDGRDIEISDVSKDLPQSNSLSEKLVESNECDQKEICVECVNDSLFDKIPFPVTPITEITLLNKETHNVPLDSLDKEIPSAQENNIAEELNDGRDIEISEVSKDLPQSNSLSEKLAESNECDQKEICVECVNDSLFDKIPFPVTPITEITLLNKETHNVPLDSLDKEITSAQENNIAEELNDGRDIDKNEFPCTNKLQESDKPTPAASALSFENFDDETPFLPKHKQLPRTPVTTKSEYPSDVQTKRPKNCKKNSVTKKKKTFIKKSLGLKESEIGRKTPSEEAEKRNDEAPITNSQFPPTWDGCQWRRDLEYAAKALPCEWILKFEEVIHNMKPFSSHEVAENEMKKAIEDMHGSSWEQKEEAMLTMIQLAKHHPKIVRENTATVAFVLCNEVKNFRQPVAGKAILTIGHLYEIMGKNFENKLRLVIGALLAKSGNRTSAAYFRLAIKTLFKIMKSSPQKAAMAFISEGNKQTNKAARETAAQFLAILTENLGPENSLTPTLSSHMIKCAATFSSDSSALTRYCGKRMLKVFMKHPNFEKIKDHHLDIDTVHNLTKVLEQITSKGIGEDVLPINLID